MPYTRFQLQEIANRIILRTKDDTRHKCFVSYHAADSDEVATFLEDYGSAFIPRVIGVSEEDDFIESDDDDYVRERIRTKYLTDSTVTIVLIGGCTWGRKFVDWEVYSSLRNDPVNKRNGLVAINLPSVGSGGTLPARVNDNVKNSDEGYARWWVYPSSTSSLKNMIQEAFDARTGKANLVANTRARRKNNAACP